MDTHPNLDGQQKMFIDLAHFTQDGRRQLAESFFNGIKEILEKELDVSEPVDPAR